MKKMLAALCLIVTGFWAVIGGTALAAEPAAFTQQEALDAAGKWADLVGKADVAALEGLLNDGYLHIHGTALVEKKSQFLGAFTSGARRYDPIVMEETLARVFGSTAIVTGRFNLRAHLRDRTLEGVNRFSLVLMKNAAGVEVVSFQATSIPR